MTLKIAKNLLEMIIMIDWNEVEKVEGPKNWDNRLYGLGNKKRYLEKVN